jgi:phage tail sheath protein FI
MFQFNSPAFNGIGFSSHALTIEQLETQRRKSIADAAKAAADQAVRDAKNTNLAKFLVNVESRIYAQLSKQLADAMFTDGGANSGNMNFQGTNISWVKTGTEVTLTIIEATGNRTDVTVPIASFAF